MMKRTLGFLALCALVGAFGCEGPQGLPGADGQDGTNGNDGADGQNGVSCWDLNANGAADLASEDRNSDGVVDVRDCTGSGGQPGYGYLPLEPAGIVGFVKDTAGEPVVGATVYLVPVADIPTAPLALTDIVAERASTVDEPLEDTIAANGATYAHALTDPNGIYRIPTMGSGSYYLVVVPSDAGHLPGGSLCRNALASADAVGKQLNVKVSTAPSAAAEYVGPSVCLNCHGVVHEKQTLHMLGIRKIGTAGPLQNGSRFPDWNEALALFTSTGTTLYFYGYNGNATSPDWKVSEVNPGSNVSFTMRLYSVGASYFAELADVKAGTGATAIYPAELSYGGGLYKQRYLTNIGGSRYVLPIQYNFQGQLDETQPYSRWVWSQYNAQNWYVESGMSGTPGLKAPPKSKSFDNNCAGCHFSGYHLTGNSTDGYKAHGTPDVNGDMDYDGDGQPETMNISCETCHGPGSEHWEHAGQGRAIVNPSLLTPEREVTLCAQCHTRALGIGGGATEAPLDSSGHMPRPGTSRHDFLTSHVSKLDDGQWDAVKGDGKHAKKHHQQASDFIKSKKYRNGTLLVTCSACHDLHGNTGLSHQIQDRLDTANGGPGLCLGCHDATYPAGATVAAREQAHYSSKGIMNIPMGDIGCTQCHMVKTAKSGSGTLQSTIAGTSYYWGDISSHLFDVPRRASIATKAGDMMAIPYTNSCATMCHTAAP